MKRKNKFILGTAGLALSLLAFGGGMYGLNTETKTASADTVSTSPYCLTNGITTSDGKTSSGSPSNFDVYMKASRSSGSATISNGYLTNWSQYYVMVDAIDVTEHLRLDLYKSGSLYKAIDVSGDADITTNFGGLPSGDYTLRYECRYKKNLFTSNVYYIYEYTFKVDIDKPTYSLSAGTGTGTNSYYTNKNITYTASDPNFSYIRYQHDSSGEYKYSYGKSVTVIANAANNGFWFFQAFDALGNGTAIVNRFIDTVAPVGSVYNQDEVVFANGSATNTPFIYTATDAGAVAKIEYKSPTVTTWTSYPNNVSILTSNGWYYFRATDGAGNISDEYRIYYDTTKPTGCVYDAGGARGSGSITNKSYVKYVASDSGSGIDRVYVKKPGSSSFVSYTNDSQLTAEGKYYFKAYDKAGNLTSTTHEITLDLTAPVGQLKANGVNVASGSYTSKSFSYTATDAVGVAILQMKRPNSTSWETYTAGTAITGAEGWYYFRATDTAGNVSAESKIFYDTSKPTVTLIGANIGGSGTVLTSGGVVGTECIRATAVDTGSGIASLRVWGDNYASAVSYVGGTELTKEGRYYFDATNRAGITSETYRIILDKTAPNGLLYADGTQVASGTITNADKIKYIANDSLAGVQSWFVKKPNTSTFVAYTSTTELTEEGKYEFYSVDYAGNQSAISTITINRSIPSAQLYADGNAITNGSYTNKQYIKFVSDGTCYVKKPNATAYISYVSGTEFYEAGKYEFYAENEAGTRTETYVVIIDRMPKIVTFGNVSGEYAQGPVTITWPERDPNVYAPITKITINGVPFEFGSIVYTLPGMTYDVLITDKAGTMFKQTFKSKLDVMPTETLGKQYYEVVYNETQTYDFPTFEAAAQFALYPQRNTYQIKEWNTESWDQGIPMDTKDSVNAKNGTYYVYKSEEDPDKLVAYFTFERLEEVAYKYAKESVKAYYFWEKEPVACIEGVSLDVYAGQNKVVGTKVELLEGYLYTLDGVGYTQLTITEPGAHALLIEDGYGGSVEYEIYILDKPQTIQYALGDNSPSTAEYDRTYYFKDRVTVSVPFEGDEFAMFEVTNVDTGESLGFFDIANACYIEESGKYAVNSMNHYGISETFTFIISMNGPTITLTEDAEAKRLDILIEESEDKYSNIVFFEITKSLDGGETWEILIQDDYGKKIVAGTLEYHFRTSGMYKVTVMDVFRTGIDAVTYTAEYTQAEPIGELEGVENGGITNAAVTFTWVDEAVVMLTKNGVAIEYKSGAKLTEDGAYVLTFSNYDGYKKTYTFEIDTVAPVVTLEGARNGEFVNAGVKAYFADNETAEIFKNGKSLGSYLGGSNVTEDGEYRILVKDRANNETAVTFTIDTTVDWSININEKGLANSVTVTANEDVGILLTKDGAVVEYTLGEAITEIGEYSLEITDSLGNMASRNFAIVAPIVREFTHNFDDVLGVEKVLVNGEDKRLNYGTLELFADGVYEVGVVVDGETYTFTVTVDSTLPEITLDGVENGGATNGNVTITATSETAALTVYLNGEEIEYTLGDILMEEGSYRAVATDLANNSVEVSFVIDKTAPIIILNGVENAGKTKGEVSLTDLSETATVVVVKDAETIKYTLGDLLNEAGRYAITVTDTCGNVSEYSFEITKGISGWAIAGIVFGSLTLIAGVVLIILKKRGTI